MKCPNCGKKLSCLAGCSSHPLNWYCKHCDYRAWQKDKDADKPDCKYIYLTGATAGWDEPHWCADKITEDDIAYIRAKDVTDLLKKIREHIAQTTHQKAQFQQQAKELMAEIDTALGES